MHLSLICNILFISFYTYPFLISFQDTLTLKYGYPPVLSAGYLHENPCFAIIIMDNKFHTHICWGKIVYQNVNKCSQLNFTRQVTYKLIFSH